MHYILTTNQIIVTMGSETYNFDVLEEQDPEFSDIASQKYFWLALSIYMH